MTTPKCRNTSRFISWWIALVVWTVGVPSASTDVTAAHALLISVDGLRADAVTPELTPHLVALMHRGTWARHARCAIPSVTIPNHVSMVTGLTPAHHHFELNRAEDYPPNTYVSGTMLEIVHAVGRTTALYVSKKKLALLAPPTMLTREVATDTGTSREIVATFLKDLAASTSGGWDLTMMHLTDPDAAGHAKGWMSKEYKRAVTTVDEEIGRIVDALERRKLLDTTLVIITADHGGIGRNHVLHVPEVMNIPWIALGPPGLPVGTPLEGSIGPCDIMPTILAALGLPIPPGLDGSSVLSLADHTSVAERPQ